MNKSTGTCLAELLVEMGWLSGSEADDALAVAKETDTPLGNVLILREKLTCKELQALILAQSLIRDGYIDRKEALRALSICTWSGLCLEDSLLLFLGRVVDKNKPYSKRMGQLLIAAGCIERETIEHTLGYCRRVGMPLGRALCMRRLITKPVLRAVLEAQKLLRETSIKAEYVITGLAAINIGTDDLPSITTDDLPLGTLLTHGGVLESIHLSEALKLSISESKPLGQILLGSSLVSQPLLDKALTLQQLLRDGRIRARRAVKALGLAHRNNLSVHEALTSINDTAGVGLDISLALFLKRTGSFQNQLRELDDIDHRGLSENDQSRLISEFILPEQLTNALRCSFFARFALLTFEQALLAYHYSLSSEQEVDDFVVEVGWLKPEFIQMLGRKRSERKQVLVTV
jgi:hypothetical protein